MINYGKMGKSLFPLFFSVLILSGLTGCNNPAGGGEEDPNPGWKVSTVGSGFNVAIGLAISDDDGVLYVGANNTNYITALDLSTGSRTSFPYSDFNGCRYVAVAGTDLYVPNCRRHSICGIDTLTDGVTLLAGLSGTSGSADGTGTDARFTYPDGIATDGTELYVSDSHSIRKIVISTGVVTAIAGSSSSGSDDGNGTAAKFSSPAGLALNGTDLYVAD